MRVHSNFSSHSEHAHMDFNRVFGPLFRLVHLIKLYTHGDGSGIGAGEICKNRTQMAFHFYGQSKC